MMKKYKRCKVNYVQEEILEQEVWADLEEYWDQIEYENERCDFESGTDGWQSEYSDYISVEIRLDSKESLRLGYEFNGKEFYLFSMKLEHQNWEEKPNLWFNGYPLYYHNHKKGSTQVASRGSLMGKYRLGMTELGVRFPLSTSEK